MYGQERLRSVIRTCRGRTAQDTLEAIRDSVLTFVADSELPDDLTLLILRRRS